MIKRMIGLLAAAATIAVIVFAVISRHKYTSMLNEHTTEQTVASTASKASAHEDSGSAATQPIPADSLASDRE